MNKTKQVCFILLSFAAIIFLPLISTYLNFLYRLHEEFPKHYFKYPMTNYQVLAPFSWIVFVFVALGGLVIICLYFFPPWFGFKRTPIPPVPKVRKVKWPWWFWLGFICFATCIILLWRGQHNNLGWFLHWSDFPLFWGLALLIDGWVYVRNGGRSMVNDRPQELIGIGVSSAVGWMLFEYLNFFVDYDWYYPFGDQISNEQFLFYAIVISTGLLPLSFVFYDLFNTVPVLKTRFTEGFKFIMPEKIKTILLVLSLLSLFATGFFPSQLFFVLWISPAVLIGVVLDKLGIWTPLRSIGKGNWRPTLVFALTYLAAGLCLECENYFSAARDIAGNPTYSQQPAFWEYNLPYVNKYHLFQMPLLGYLGYMPFGIYCWLWWIAFAYMQGIPSMLFQEKPLDPIIDDK